MRRIHVQVPDETFAKLEQIKEETALSKSSIVRAIVIKGLNECTDSSDFLKGALRANVQHKTSKWKQD